MKAGLLQISEGIIITDMIDMPTGYVPGEELSARLDRFRINLDAAHKNWELCAITGYVSLFYFTGTVCNGVLLLRRSGEAVLWVRKSYERALIESAFPDIRPMESFRDIAGCIGSLPHTLYLDTACASMEWYSMLSKYMSFKHVLPVDKVILQTRAVKSDYELERMRTAGSTVDRLLRENLPSMLRKGMSEAELGIDLLSLYMKNGYQGINRFSMRSGEMLLGHIAFGDSSLYPSVFDGASGVAGLCPAVPVLGSYNRYLCEGDLIFVDTCFGVDGYQVDKTVVFSYKKPQPAKAVYAHRHCLGLERQAVAMMRPGAVPSDIYIEVAGSVSVDLRDSFMGAAGRRVKFIGHGTGLYSDEMPVIAKGFDTPLEKGMTIAIEPKIGLEGIGMVGTENTYLITDDDAECITGTSSDIVICN
jgi:Xaa-Pro aminopeptidase